MEGSSVPYVKGTYHFQTRGFDFARSVLIVHVFSHCVSIDEIERITGKNAFDVDNDDNQVLQIQQNHSKSLKNLWYPFI